MAYHQATIQLKSIGTAIGIKGFLGLPVNLDQVDKSIRELEDFLSSRDDGQASGVNWEKGTLIMPDEGVLKNSTMREKELWARHIESEGKAPPPGHEPDGAFRQERKMLAQAKAIYGQMSRHLIIASFMVVRQQAFLQSGNWMDKTRLTIQEIAEHLPEWGEKTVRESVHSLGFALGAHRFPADVLVCASELPALCGQLSELQEHLPNAGAPLLTKELHAQGINVSQRAVGNALQLLASHKAKRLA